jgi:hypothetical protein
MDRDPSLIKIFQVHCDFHNIIINRSADYLPINFSMKSIKIIAQKYQIEFLDIDRYLTVLVEKIADDKKAKYLMKPAIEVNDAETIMVFYGNIPKAVDTYIELWCTGEQKIFQ